MRSWWTEHTEIHPYLWFSFDNDSASIMHLFSGKSIRLMTPIEKEGDVSGVRRFPDTFKGMRDIVFLGVLENNAMICRIDGLCIELVRKLSCERPDMFFREVKQYIPDMAPEDAIRLVEFME